MSIKRNFPGPFATVYQAAKLGWINCKKKQPEFASFRAIYILLYIENNLDAIEAAERMPDEQARNEEHQTDRLQMEIFADASITQWKYLSRYVSHAYPASEVPAKLDACGASLYESAVSQRMWKDLGSMLTSGLTFIENNETDLLANGNAPANFKQAYTDDRKKFNDKYLEFLASEENSKVATDAKIAATNAIFSDLSDMLKDGQTIFDLQPALKDMFIYERLSELVQGVGASGLKGKAVYQINNKPVIGLSAEIEERDMVVTVDDQGVYDFGNQMASGVVLVKYKLNGTVVDEETITLPVGTTVTKNIKVSGN